MGFTLQVRVWMSATFQRNVLEVQVKLGRLATNLWVWPLLAMLGCAESGDPRQKLASQDPQIRVAAVCDLANHPAPDSQILLIQTLADQDEGVRFYAAAALHRLTGKRFDFEVQGDPRQRREAILRWVDWYTSEHPDAAGQFEALRSRLAPPEEKKQEKDE
jgi:hypothetical protein